MSELISRRSLLAGGAALAAGAAVASCLPEVDGQWKDEGLALCTSSDPRVTPGNAAQAGRVLEIHDAALSDVSGSSGPVVHGEQVAADLQKLLLALAGKADVRAAWAALIPDLAADDVVGIKVNTLNKQAPTRPELVKAMVDSLKAGLDLPAERIVIWDRRLDELTASGFTAASMGATVEGTWDAAQGKGAGRGYELGSICIGGRKTHLSNILTRRIRHLINMAIMKRHDASGFTGCLKNHYGSIDNPGDFHDKPSDLRFAHAIPAINAQGEVLTKTRLLVVDAIFGVCKGGTESSLDCVPNKILAGLDPVAIDVRARQIRDAERGEVGPDPETISQAWIDAAAKAGLGSTTIKLETIS